MVPSERQTILGQKECPTWRRVPGGDEWFETFDSQKLALLYRAKKSSGEGSTFFKLVNR